MKYGIKHTNGQIEAISRFANNVIPVGFIEITESKYDGFLDQISVNPYVVYDIQKNTLIADEAALADAQAAGDLSVLRSSLRRLSIELDLQTRLGEDTTATQAEFNTLMAEYQGA